MGGRRDNVMTAGRGPGSRRVLRVGGDDQRQHSDDLKNGAGVH